MLYMYNIWGRCCERDKEFVRSSATIEKKLFLTETHVSKHNTSMKMLFKPGSNVIKLTSTGRSSACATEKSP